MPDPIQKPITLGMFVLLLLFPGFLWAQLDAGLNKDSLKQVLNSIPADTSKVLKLIMMGQQYEGSEPDTAVYYYQQAKVLSVQLHYISGTLRYISNFTAVLNVQGRFDESLRLNLEAIEISKKNGLQTQLIKALINTGNVYQYKEDYQSAVNFYLQALPYLESENNPQYLSLVYSNLCGLYRSLKKFDKALHYARLSLTNAQKNNDQYNIGLASVNMGNVLVDSGRYAEAVVFLQRALQIGRIRADINLQETALIDLANAYLQTKQPEQYIAAYKAALPLAQAIDDVSGQSYALYGLGLGLFWQKAYKQAETHLHAALRFVQQHNQKEVWRRMLLLMSDVQIALGKPEESVQYDNRSDSLTDVLLNAPLLQNIQELETKYEVEKRRRELLQKNLLLEQKNLEVQRQRTWLGIAGSGVVLLFILFLLGVRLYRQRQQLNLKAVQSLQAQQETIRLKSMLEGEQQERKRISQEMHDDMGSGLTRMLFLSRAIDQPGEVAYKIGITAGTLIKKMNEIIWTMNNEQDTLESLLAYLRASTAELLETAGIPYNFDVAGTIADVPLNHEFRRNIYLAVKEAVHNVIRHANATHVDIKVAAAQVLQITVHDNGKGFDQAKQTRFGNGMKNMRQRMAQVNGDMTINAANGTLITFTATLPL